MPTVLFESDLHRVVVFNDLVRGDDGVQANQFLVQHGNQSALIDPGGALLYTPLSLALSRFLSDRSASQGGAAPVEIDQRHPPVSAEV